MEIPVPMHMADSLLSPTVGLTCSVAAVGMLVYSARKFAAESEHDEKIPLAGVLGAFVFAGQMLNFAVPGTGSSGHIGGGLLLAALLGPYAAFLTIAAVLVIQCLFFQDGGILALGCNVLNLGLWPCLLGLPLFRMLRGAQPPGWRHTLAAVAAVVVSLELGAFGVVVETLLSGRTELPFKAFAPLMAGIHLPIAICEGVLTAGVLRFVERVRPGVAVYMAENVRPPGDQRSARPVLVTLALCALLMAGVFSWFASQKPDGLEWSMGRVSGKEELDRPASGWVARTQQWVAHLAIFPDYDFKKTTHAESAPGATGGVAKSGTSAAGVTGAAATGLLVLCVCGVLWLARRRATFRGT